MLLIKHMFNFNKKKKTKDTSMPNFEEDKVVLTIGLTDDYEIDIGVEINNLSIDNTADKTFKSQKIAQFLYTVFSGGINFNISEIMLKQIGDTEQYQEFINSIIYNWLLLEQTNNSTERSTDIQNIPLVKPTQAFTKYTNE